MWAITSYFNPAGYRRRLINYRLFRQHLQVPLVAVELSFGQPFELQADDADILIQLHGADVMWQKERLLNVALQHVPDACEHIAWLDADVLFREDDWHQRAAELLEQYAVLHLFQSAWNLLPQFPLTRDFTQCQPAGRSHTYCVDGCGLRELLATENYIQSKRTYYRTGMAWAARAEIVRASGIYDRCIVGGGDRAWHAMALDLPHLAVAHCRMSAAQQADYMHWANIPQREIQGRLGWLDRDIYHLWHGSLENRRTTTRYRILEEFEFDPASDLALDSQGFWKWNSDKADMHQLVADYFVERREDEELPV